MRSKTILRAGLLAATGLGLFSATASASTLPTRKSGLWETTMTMTMMMNGQNRVFPTSSVICTDPQVQALEEQRMAGSHCGAAQFTGSGNTYRMDSSCPLPNGAGTVTVHGTLVFSGNTAAHMEADTTSPHGTGHMAADSKWIGPCPAGVQPGDRGRIVNGQFQKEGNVLESSGNNN